ncbi:MAG: Wzz/FepE/Etk N-terminal domain-containing protein, partial [Candidatus Kapabacteria bacterium]|nr:Wzz/FepE/Etk N-terminal domain-containing protein [Candidatus Kapabacteria bacterium]
MNNFNEPKEFTLINLVKLVLLNKKFLILTVGIFTLIILAVSFIIPHTYGSTTTLLPPKKD